MSTSIKVENDAEPSHESNAARVAVTKREEQDEAPEAGDVVPNRTKTSPTKVSLEQPHKILPSAWLETEYYEVIDRHGTSDKICFGMVCTTRNPSTSMYELG